MTISLNLHDVMDRGIPNLERVPIQILSDYYLQSLWIGLGKNNAAGQLLPINDNALWLGTGWLKAGDWIFVYTGKGSPKTNKIPNSGNATYTFHWNRNSVLFSSSELHPYLLDGRISLPPAVRAPNYVNALADLTGHGEKGTA